MAFHGVWADAVSCNEENVVQVINSVINDAGVNCCAEFFIKVISRVAKCEFERECFIL